MIEFTAFASVEFCNTKETSANAPQGTGTRVDIDSILFFNVGKIVSKTGVMFTSKGMIE